MLGSDDKCFLYDLLKSRLLQEKRTNMRSNGLDLSHLFGSNDGDGDELE